MTALSDPKAVREQPLASNDIKLLFYFPEHDKFVVKNGGNLILRSVKPAKV
ncbi:MAG: hypothetical protein KME45_16845 [Stenomitos rutilans HA7619-LM2]|jgi:hypothetical protein|nr:hypothetical protein [Stenomitos rutilans HA7619-LM2]